MAILIDRSTTENGARERVIPGIDSQHAAARRLARQGPSFHFVLRTAYPSAARSTARLLESQPTGDCARIVSVSDAGSVQ